MRSLELNQMRDPGGEAGLRFALGSHLSESPVSVHLEWEELAVGKMLNS